MAHFIRKALAAGLVAGGVYFLYTGIADSDFNMKDFSLDKIDYDSIREAGNNVGETILQEIDKPDYELSEDDMFDEHHDILEGDIPVQVIENLQAEGKLDVEMGGCEFVICLSGDDSFMVRAENMDKYQCFVEDSVLVLRGTGAVTDLSNINMQKSEVTLYVPEDYVFSEAEFELGAGNMEIESINALKLKLECGAGRIDVQYADTAEGEFKCSAGSVNVRLFGVKSDYNYSIKSAVGMVQIDDESYSGVTAKQDIRNNSEKDIEIECTMGSICLEF